MNKVSKLLKSEYKWAQNFFLYSKRGPLVGIILIVVAIPLATLLVSNSNQESSFRRIPSQVADECTCINGGEWGNPNPVTRHCGDPAIIGNTDQTPWVCCPSTTAGNINGWVNRSSCIIPPGGEGGQCGNDPSNICGYNQTCVAFTPTNNASTCVPVGSVKNGDSCDPDGGQTTTNNSACISGYCSPTTFTCANKPGGGTTPTPTGTVTGGNTCPEAYDIPSNSNKTSGTICGNSADISRDPNTYNYTCANGKWNPGGQCNPGGASVTTCPNTFDKDGKDVIGAKPGTKICGNSDTTTDPKKYYYTCGNDGKWSAKQADCTPPSSNGSCQCTGGHVGQNQNYTAKCGDIVCGSDNHSYTCTYPGGGGESYKYTNALCQNNTGPGGGTNPNPTANPTMPANTPTPTSATPTPTNTPIPSNTPTPTVAGPTATGTTTPTTTSAPGNTNILLSLAVDGIGSNTANGQNNNPTPNPIKTQVQVFDVNNNKVQDTSADLAYDAASGTFKGKVPVNITSTGPYTVKARFNNTLWKKIVKTLTTGIDNNMPFAKLINGDLNQDNQLNLLDYNAMLSCLKGNCGSAHADLNLDGKINNIDTNLLYYHFKNREGD